MSKKETNVLLARFMQEEAFDYVECIGGCFLHQEDELNDEEPIYRA